MSLSTLSRAKFAGALVGAFLGGLIIASGFNRTPFGYAQTTPVSRVTSTTPKSTNPAGAVADLSTAFTSIAEHVTPAVVSVQAERTQTTTQRNRRGNQVPDLEDFFGQFGPQIQQQPRAASGSGFIVSRDGYILTNNHVVDSFDKLHVTLNDRRTFEARLVGRDPTTDVALLKIDANNLPVAALGNDESTQIGEWVLAIGNPLGLDFTVTAGIVSAKGRDRTDLPLAGNAGYNISDFIQTDAAINPGNSGGPLVNIRGEVIGINSMIASATGYYSGYGFAIPITLAKEVMDDIIAHGRVRRAMLGVRISNATPEDAAAAGLKDITGVQVGDFSGDNSPARAAGLQPGDVIIKADGKDAGRVSALQRIIREHEPGDVVTVEAMRFGQDKTFRVKLGEVPDSTIRVADSEPRNEPTERGAVSGKLGITVQPVTADEARENNIPADRRGLRVTDVNENGPGRTHFLQDEILVSTLFPSRTVLHTVDDLQQVLSKVKDGQLVSFLVYNAASQGTRVETIKVGAN